MDPEIINTSAPERFNFLQQLYAQLSDLSGVSFQSFFDFSNSNFILGLKLVALLFTTAFAILLVWILSKIKHDFFVPEPATPAGEAVPPTPEQQRRTYENEWRQVQSYVNSVSESEWKVAVIEADKLVDDALKLAGVPGDTMGERLMSLSSSQLASLQGVWDAHKLRNYIVHDVTVTLSQQQAIQAVDQLGRALVEIGVLDPTK